MDKGFWMPKEGGDAFFDSPCRMGLKRGHQWLLDAVESELFPCKNQVVENPNYKQESGIITSNALPCENPSGFLSVPSVPNLFMDQPFRYENKPANLTEGNMFVFGSDSSNMKKKDTDEQFDNDASVGLSISYAVEDLETTVSYGGTRKVKINQVEDFENELHTFVEHNLGMSVDVDPAYSNGSESAVMSMEQPHTKEGGNVTLMGHSHDIGDANLRSIDSNYVKGDFENGLHTSVEHNLGMFMDLAYSKRSENTVASMEQLHTKEGGNATLMGHSYDIGDANIGSMGSTYVKVIDNALSMTCSSNKRGPNALSFGSYQDVMDALARPVSSYSLLYEQPLVQTSEMPSRSRARKSKLESACKKKSEKKSAQKEAPKSFPTNVRSLLVTGMLEGVTVRYISASQEKELRGIIKGSSYLCGCQSCNYSKALNAYEFEQHAGCKTSHPNNHIHFENGKTIHQIVQDLKATPESMLFDAIQTVTGSPINQNAFHVWKESFQGATSDLHRKELN